MYNFVCYFHVERQLTYPIYYLIHRSKTCNKIGVFIEWIVSEDLLIVRIHTEAFLVVWVWTNMLLIEVVDIISVDDDIKIEEFITELISTLMLTSVLNVYSMLN